MDSTIWTIGHSTRPLDAFLELLAHYRLEAVADVRRFPGSRRQPQYAEAAAERVRSPQHGIAYRWLPALGGRRRPLPDSPNTTWRNASFRGYADHIGSAEFSKAWTSCSKLVQPSAHHVDVRGSDVVALPSGADRRCAVRPRH